MYSWHWLWLQCTVHSTQYTVQASLWSQLGQVTLRLRIFTRGQTGNSQCWSVSGCCLQDCHLPCLASSPVCLCVDCDYDSAISLLWSLGSVIRQLWSSLTWYSWDSWSVLVWFQLRELSHAKLSYQHSQLFQKTVSKIVCKVKKLYFSVTFVEKWGTFNHESTVMLPVSSV